jgi:hemerythrin
MDKLKQIHSLLELARNAELNDKAESRKALNALEEALVELSTYGHFGRDDDWDEAWKLALTIMQSRGHRDLAYKIIRHMEEGLAEAPWYRLDQRGSNSLYVSRWFIGNALPAEAQRAADESIDALELLVETECHLADRNQLMKTIDQLKVVKQRAQRLMRENDQFSVQVTRMLEIKVKDTNIDEVA